MTDGSIDVVIIGFGFAGMSAAITAHDTGASVLVVEKALPEVAGGNSRVSGQVWFAPTDLDAAERHLRALAGGFPVDESVVAAWAQETSGNSDWVLARAEETAGRVPRDDGDRYEGDGTDIVRFPFGSLLPGGESAPGHTEEWWELEGADCGAEYVAIGGEMGWSRLWLTLRTAVEDRGIPVRYATEATGLVRGADDAVVGVEVRSADGASEVIRTRGGVVLAAGGFAANAEMCRNYARLTHAVPWGSPACTGDGIRMAQGVGADLAHPYNYMGQPGIAAPPYPSGISLMPLTHSTIQVGADGRRFADDSLSNRHGKAWVRGVIDMHPAGEMWTILDEAGLGAAPLCLPRELVPVGYLTQIERYEWSLDNRAEVERGWITKADTLAELAEQLGIDPAGLEAEVAEYNAWAEAGVDDPRFGRPAATMVPLGPGPYYGYRWGQLLITTLGGVRKDGRARALDPNGEPIPGLYCAGDVASSYSWGLSGGMGIGDALAFGRIAGRESAGRAAGADDSDG